MITDEIKIKYLKYKDQRLNFRSYYKYEFTYQNDLIQVVVGGDRDDIYRAGLNPFMTLEELVKECGDEYLTIMELEPKIVCDCHCHCDCGGYHTKKESFWKQWECGHCEIPI